MQLRPSLIPQSFERDGFALLKAAVPDAQLKDLSDAIDAVREPNQQSAAGLRHLLQRCPAVLALAESEVIREIVVAALGSEAKPVRAILFDKTPESNWYVTWHQDVTIAVKNLVEVPGFGPWSIKNDILHVQPPADILEKMVALRIHFDASPEENGAIKFINGSHNHGILNPTELNQFRAEHQEWCCPAERGDIIMMRPLTIHSSSKATLPEHRRVLHIEFGCGDLPGGIEWAVA